MNLTKVPVVLANQACCTVIMELQLLNVPLKDSIKNLVRKLTWLGRTVLHNEWKGNFFLTQFGNQVTDDCNHSLTKRAFQKQCILDLFAPCYPEK